VFRKGRVLEHKKILQTNKGTILQIGTLISVHYSGSSSGGLI
jgi:hypothetical protein